MLKFYLTTVIIYMILLYCEVKVFKNGILKNGWGSDGEKNMSAFSALFCYSAIPLFRFIIAVFLFIMAIYPKEKIMTWIKENKQEK